MNSRTNITYNYMLYVVVSPDYVCPHFPHLTKLEIKRNFYLVKPDPQDNKVLAIIKTLNFTYIYTYIYINMHVYITNNRYKYMQIK